MTQNVAVTDRMAGMVGRWQNEADRRAVFLQCYLLMTRNMVEAVEQGEFEDPHWVDLLLHRFADYYFSAVDAYEQDPATCPAVWRVAFAAADERQTQVLQNLLLGINAHINYDLVLTLEEMLRPEWAGLSDARRRCRYDDHCYVNEIIGRTIDAVQDSVLEQLAPELNLVDVVLGPVDEWLTSRLITRWREGVWRDAMRLLAAPDTAARSEVHRQVVARTLQRADAILMERSPQSIRSLL